jgi:hypothetical protein
VDLERRRFEKSDILEHCTSDYFERIIGTQWMGGVEEDEGILYFFFLRYFQRHESSRPQAYDESPVPKPISPE